MGPIKIARSLEEEVRQGLYIYKILRNFELKGLKKDAITPLVPTFIIFVLSFFADLEFLIGGYIVMAGTWLIYLTRHFIKWRKFNSKRKRLLLSAQEKFDANEEYFLEFNENWVRFTTPNTSVEIKWRYFRAYLEEMDTIYLLMEQVDATWSFSKKEIGEDCLMNLKRITKKKLPYLKY